MSYSIKKELARKTVHLLSALIIVMYMWLFSESPRLPLYLLAIMLIVTIEIEYLRVETKLSHKLMDVKKKFMRKKEIHHLGGDAFFLIGAIIALSIFDIWIATIAIFMTTFGDLFASLIGRVFGRHKISKKSSKTWEGTVSEFIVDICIGLFVVGPLAGIYPLLAKTLPEPYIIVPVIIVMALTATFVEVVVSKLDDNLLIPLFAGFNGQLLTFLLSLSVVVH